MQRGHVRSVRSVETSNLHVQRINYHENINNEQKENNIDADYEVEANQLGKGR